MDEATLARVLDEALNKRARIDPDLHQTHHDYVARLIDRDRIRAERWEKLRLHVYGWGAISAIGGLVYLVGEGVKEFLKNLLMRGGSGP